MECSSQEVRTSFFPTSITILTIQVNCDKDITILTIQVNCDKDITASYTFIIMNSVDGVTVLHPSANLHNNNR